MWPGFTSKLSEANLALAAVVDIKTDLVRVTDTTTTTVLTQISPNFGGGQFSGVTFVANDSGAAITTVTTGNILKAVSIPDKQVCVFVYSKLAAKWYPGAIS